MGVVYGIKKVLSKQYKEKVKGNIKIKKYVKYEKLCRKTNQKQYIICSTPIHGNLGDHAIAMAEYEMLKKQGIEPFEIATHEEEYCFNKIAKRVPHDAVIRIKLDICIKR